MSIAFLVTNADPRRPNLAFKIEFEDDDTMQEWLDQRLLAGSRQERNLQPFPEPANTGVMLLWDKQNYAHPHMDFKEYRLQWEQVVFVLTVADDMERKTYQDGPGRPPKRVLASTTSKERRTPRPTRTY